MNRIATSLAAIVVSLPLAFASIGVAAAQNDDDCISGRQIQQAINDGLILELAEAMEVEGIDAKPLSEPDVCRVDGQLQYRVNIMNSYGEAERIVLNAQAN